MKDFFNQDIICLDKDSQYEFIYNSEKLLSDDCHSNIYGDSYCYLDDSLYNNVTYRTIYFNCTNSIKFKDIFLNPFFIIIITLPLFYVIIKKFFFKML